MLRSRTICKSGFRLRFLRNITKNDFLIMMDRLGQVFGEGYIFEPEQITEGGIICTQWPGKTDDMRKSMRFTWRDDRWPLLSNYRQEWSCNGDILFEKDPTYPKRRLLRDWNITVLKAFRGAPRWTREELQKFESVFSEFGILVHYKDVTL